MNPFRSLPSAARVSQEAAHPWRGANEHDKQVAEAAVALLLANIGADAELPTRIVAGGPFHFRQVFLRAFQGFRLIDDGVADLCYDHFLAIHQIRYPGLTPAEVLDAWWEPTPLTQAEIDAAWEVESDSTEEARRFFYGDKHPTDYLKMICDPTLHDPLVVTTGQVA